MTANAKRLRSLMHGTRSVCFRPFAAVHKSSALPSVTSSAIFRGREQGRREERATVCLLDWIGSLMGFNRVRRGVVSPSLTLGVRGMIITRPILERLRRSWMRGDIPAVVPAVIFEPDAAVSVAATDGGFVKHVEVFESSVFLAVQADKIREQDAGRQPLTSGLSRAFRLRFSLILVHSFRASGRGVSAQRSAKK
jgi:hypothetical protein